MSDTRSTLTGPVPPTGVGRIDLVSAVFAVVAVLAVTLTLQQGPDLGWPLWLWAVFAAGLAASAVFVWLQFRARRLAPPSLQHICLGLRAE